MSSSRRRHRSLSAPPLEDENLLPEILLRLPPQPSSLPRASLVCKRWRRLASDPGFLRRFRIHHRRSPPLLGCFVEQLDGISFVPTLEGPNRVPPGRFSLQFKHEHGNGFMLLDCRHGLVLISDWRRRQFVVWDPVTGDQHRVSVPAGLDPKRTEISGAVLRAAGDIQHFRVVCVATRCDDIQHGEAAVACVYSSETGEWGNPVSAPIPSESSIALYRMLSFRTISREPAVLVGDSIYWILTTCSTSIVEFNFETQSLAVTRVPHVPIYHFKVIRADSGGLGFLYMSESDFTVQLWKPKTCDILASCKLGRTIELGKLLPVNQEKDNILIVGFAEENNMVFLRTLKGLYAVHLQSLELKNLPETNGRPHYYPFESVYTSDVDGEHGRAELFAQCIG